MSRRLATPTRNEINGRFGTTHAQLSWRSWPSDQKDPISLETFVQHIERREAESRKGGNVDRGARRRVATVLLPIGVMMMSSIASELTSAAGTSDILPTAKPRPVWPT